MTWSMTDDRLSKVGLHGYIAQADPGGVATMGHTPTPSRFGATFTARGGFLGGQLEGAGGLQAPTHMVCNGPLIALITLR